LAELRLADVVDIHADAADAALVSLDLMQMGGMSPIRAGVRLHNSALRAVTCAPRVTEYDNCINYHTNATCHICIKG
jgi:hypothetical protein